MKKHGVDLTVDLEALQAEYEQLQTSHAEYTGQLAAVQEELKPLKETVTGSARYSPRNRQR